MQAVSVEQAASKMLCHDITQIILRHTDEQRIELLEQISRKASRYLS